MSAIKKGLRRSGSMGKTSIAESRPALANHSKSLRSGGSSRVASRLNSRGIKEGAQSTIRSGSSSYSSRLSNTKSAVGIKQSTGWSRVLNTRGKEQYGSHPSVLQRSNALRLHTPGVQELGEDYDTANVYRKVAQYDPVEAKKERRQERVARREAQDPSSSRDYVKIQRSSAASEFIYGRSSVIAALKLGRRRLYKIYIARTAGEEKQGFEDLAKYALNRGIEVVWVTNSQSQAEMDRLAKGRPHNGVILEASPLPRLPIAGLKQARKGRPFEVELQRQSVEEEEVNGSDITVLNAATFSRYPFLVMLDEIVDQGNLGGILRSAYFLGADAVVLSSHMAALNSVALKAASGAAEGIKLLSVHNTTGFIQSSKENGWKVYAAVAPPVGHVPHKTKHIELSQLGHPLQETPCILLLGGEGDGLRRDLISKADQTLSITGSRQSQNGLDSLNVSVAAGILMETFLREPNGQPLNTGSSNSSEASYSSNILF